MQGMDVPWQRGRNINSPQNWESEKHSVHVSTLGLDPDHRIMIMNIQLTNKNKKYISNKIVQFPNITTTKICFKNCFLKANLIFAPHFNNHNRSNLI